MTPRSERGTSTTVNPYSDAASSTTVLSRRSSIGRDAGRSADAREVETGRGVDDEALQERGIEPVHVLERVEHRETRVDAEEHRRVAVGEVQIDQQRASTGDIFAAAWPR